MDIYKFLQAMSYHKGVFSLKPQSRDSTQIYNEVIIHCVQPETDHSAWSWMVLESELPWKGPTSQGPRIANSVGKTSSKRLRFDPLINIDTKDDNEITETEDVPLIEATNEENNDINNEHSEDPAFNQEDVRPWVEFSGLKLTSKHMEMILNNQKLDCDIINYYQKLLSSSFPTMQGLQDTRLVPVRRDGSCMDLCS